MSKINDFEENMEEIFNDQEEKRQQLIDELRAENDLLWSTIDLLKKTLNKL